MRYPMLIPQNVSRDMIDVFGGYNHNIRIGENEFYDMENLSSDSFPLLAVRQKRGTLTRTSISGIGSETDVKGALYRDRLYQVVRFGNSMILHGIVKNGSDVDVSWTGTASDEPRQIIPMGARLIILPDKKVINTADAHPTAQNIDNEKIATSAVSIQPCLVDGSVLSIDYVGEEAPRSPVDGFVWLDTSTSPASLKKYYGSMATWQSYLSSYVKITATNAIGAGFKVGDGVKIENITIPELEVLNNTSIVKAITNEDKSIVITGIIDPMPSRSILTAEYTQNSSTIHFLCDEQLEANLFANKRMMINNKMYTCTESTAGDTATALPIYSDVQLSDTGITLTAVENAIASNIIYVTNNAFGSGHLSGQEICFGDIDNHSFATILAQGTTANGGRYLVIDQNVTITADNKIISPITYIVPEGLYRLELKFTEVVDLHAGDKACPTLDNQYTQAYDESHEVTFSRKMPAMDFVIESQNRLWGCRYGEDNNGEFVNQIYCSKLGDPTNWQVYADNSAINSYYADCGTAGKWTGAFNYRGYPTFFKEHYIHTVYGTNPPYQIKDIEARGIQEGSSDSLAMVNEVLFYKGTHGIMAYTGGLPEEISAPLGDGSYHSATGCAYKGKYYVNMLDSSNHPVLIVYDTSKGLWHKETGLNTTKMVAKDNNVNYITPVTIDQTTLNGMGILFGSSESQIRWFAESGIFGLSSPDKKYISRLNLRMMLPVGSVVFISIQYDSSGVWERVTNVTGHSLMPFTMAIKPRRCDHFRIRLEGRGDMKLYSICKTIELGSDR